MEIFIGIDQSINSTGITVQIYENTNKIFEHFYIICNKVTKKAKKSEESLNNFDYIVYSKFEKSDANDNNEFELNKLMNNIKISDIILQIIHDNVKNPLDKLYIGMEGISYQSEQTKSLIDLAGLSTLIRYRIYKYFINHNDQLGSLKIFTPAEIKKFVTGNGNCSKDSMINLFKTSHKELLILPKVDDIADSYWICTYFRKLYCDEYKI